MVSPYPPDTSYDCLHAEDLRFGLQVPDDYDGTGIKIGIIDKDFYDHPYFDEMGINFEEIDPPETLPEPHLVHGHGPQMVMNAASIAPGAEILGIRYSDNTKLQSMELAVSLGCNILNCSWGTGRERRNARLELQIGKWIESGVIILAAGGNQGKRYWPGSDRNVISVGGAWWNPDGMEYYATDFSSSYESYLNEGRWVPDIMGLCGDNPKGIYIMSPTAPGSRSDWEYNSYGAPYPEGDETGENDGWVCTSGSSAATAQLSGVVALLLEAAATLDITLTNEQIKDILMSTSVPVDGEQSGVVNVGAAIEDLMARSEKGSL